MMRMENSFRALLTFRLAKQHESQSDVIVIRHESSDSSPACRRLPHNKVARPCSDMAEMRVAILVGEDV
jgi:hypothetical protein